MTEKELRKRWSCSGTQITYLCNKSVLNPYQSNPRAIRIFSEEEIERIEKKSDMTTEYVTIAEYAKEHNMPYMTVRNLVLEGKLRACRLFNPIRIHR